MSSTPPRPLPGRVVVTGGAGFIGSHLVEALLARGNHVVALDDLSTGDLDNLAAHRENPRLSVCVGDAADTSLLGDLLADADACVHLAAVVGVKLVLCRPAHALDVNVRCTEAVLEASARRDVPVLLASSSEVYGPNARVPLSEQADLEVAARHSSQSTYAVSKLHGERLAFAWQEQTGLPVIVARLFNTAGPRQRDEHGMVVPTFVRQALAGQPLTVHGDGRQTRSLAHVRDTVETLVRLLEAPAARGMICNVGAGLEISIDTLARRVLERTGSDAPIVRIPYGRAYGPDHEETRRRLPDLGRQERLTGRRAHIGLDEIIDDTARYWRERTGRGGGAGEPRGGAGARR